MLDRMAGRRASIGHAALERSETRIKNEKLFGSVGSRKELRNEELQSHSL
jgi:hypothetical protein